MLERVVFPEHQGACLDHRHKALAAFYRTALLDYSNMCRVCGLWECVFEAQRNTKKWKSVSLGPIVGDAGEEVTQL